MSSGIFVMVHLNVLNPSEHRYITRDTGEPDSINLQQLNLVIDFKSIEKCLN